MSSANYGVAFLTVDKTFLGESVQKNVEHCPECLEALLENRGAKETYKALVSALHSRPSSVDAVKRIHDDFVRQFRDHDISLFFCLSTKHHLTKWIAFVDRKEWPHMNPPNVLEC